MASRKRKCDVEDQFSHPGPERDSIQSGWEEPEEAWKCPVVQIEFGDQVTVLDLAADLSRGFIIGTQNMPK